MRPKVLSNPQFDARYPDPDESWRRVRELAWGSVRLRRECKRCAHKRQETSTCAIYVNPLLPSIGDAKGKCRVREEKRDDL